MPNSEGLNLKLSWILRLSPILIAIAIALGLPSIFFTVNYKHSQAEIETISKIHASFVNDAINKNPSMWQFEEHKLRALVEDRVQKGNNKNLQYKFSIVLNDGKVLAENGENLGPFMIHHDTMLYDSTESVGYFRVEISLMNLLINTAWIALISFLFSLYVAYALGTVPHRALQSSYRSLQKMASHDALTGLANRTKFMHRLEITIAQARRNKTSLLLMFIDLDNFKHINDSLGHQVGDELLVALADRLNKNIRKSDTVSRFGGDEFVIFFSQLSGDADDTNELASNIRNILASPVKIGPRELKMTSSIGLAKFPDDASDANALIKAADTAMYQSKIKGKNGFRFYSEDLSRMFQERSQIIEGLNHALERNEFYLQYQPLIDNQSRQKVAVEALIRWHHPTLGFVPPDRFIGLAEETGHIINIGSWVLKKACCINKLWQDKGHPPISVAVNVSASQFTRSDFLDSVDDALAVSGLAPEYLELEITESMLMSDLDEAFEVMQALNQRGISLSIDDFGTGYSSLSHLKRFPVSTLKIDKSFIDGVAEDGEDQLITKIIILLAKELGMKVVAEGVENEQQLQFLNNNGCDVYQGYYFSRPVNSDEVFDDKSLSKTSRNSNR